MKIQWYAHACFRIEAEGKNIVTDPYTPHKAGFRSIEKKPNLVVRSSDDDSAHDNAAMFPGSDVMTMTYAPAEGTVWRDIRFTPIPRPGEYAAQDRAQGQRPVSLRDRRGGCNSLW